MAKITIVTRNPGSVQNDRITPVRFEEMLNPITQDWERGVINEILLFKQKLRRDIPKSKTAENNNMQSNNEGNTRSKMNGMISRVTTDSREGREIQGLMRHRC